MPAPAKWDWNIGNINATAAQTQAAYTALTTNGPTRNFSVIVWNDIVNKIIEMRQYWGDAEWSAAAPCTKSQTWMIPGERMTANIFNSAVINMPPIHPWGWEATLGRKDIHQRDVCYGAYFLYLVNGLNHWIDLTPLYIRPSNPFNIQAQIQNNTLVRRALHIISQPHFRWYSTASLAVDPALHIKSRLNIRLDPRLNLPLFNTEHVRIVLILNSRLRDKVTIGDAAHVIINNPVTLTMRSGVTFGDVAFLVGSIDSTSSIISTVNPLSSVPIQLENLIELTGPSGEISTVTPSGIITDITGVFSGEAWVREPDSIAFASDLQFSQNGSLRFSTADIQPLVLNLNSLFTSTADVTPLTTDRIAAQLAASWMGRMSFSVNDAVDLSGSMTSTSLFRATANRRRTGSLGEMNLPVFLSTSALVAFAADEITTGARLTNTSDMYATAVFAEDTIATGGRLTETFRMTADTSLVLGKHMPFIVHLTDTSSMTATAIFAARQLSTGAGLSDTSSMSAKIGTNATPLYMSASVADTIGMSAAVDLDSDFFIDVKGGMTTYHSGTGTVTLDPIIETAGRVTTGFDCEATVGFADVAWVRARLGVTYTATVEFASERYILASEIDDDLVSDLDDTLVFDVEFHI